MKRALVIGDDVVIRPECVRELSADAGVPLPAHVRYTITDAETPRRRRMLWLNNELCVWPSQVRLATGTAERASIREERREQQIEAELAARREKRAAKIAGRRQWRKSCGLADRRTP